ncbi:MAG: site-specific integrase [Oscillospiraceae bacterium]|jgi:integrase|nr:site-specific integrase [Oscillospiraceae bacterium]
MPKQKSKRANGEGSFYQLPDKTWVHQITLGRKPDGSLDRKTFKAKTRAACVGRRDAYIEERRRREIEGQAEQARAAELLAEMQKRGHAIESETLFSDAFPHWLKLFKSPPTKKATTYSGYLNTYQTHFAEYFGPMPLYEITRDVVQEYYNSKQLSGSRKDGKTGALSPKTIRNHHMILRDFFDYAVDKYKLLANPAIKTDRPEVIRPRMRVLDPDEMSVFLHEVMRETQRTAILFDLFMGLRVGELLAAEVDDIHIKTQSITINRNIIRVSTTAIDPSNPQIRILNYNPMKKTHLIVQETPKTKNAVRNIPISDAVFELLAKRLYYLQQSGWPNPYNLLFPSTTGSYIDPKSFEIRLREISKRCEIKKVNPHALCHTFATRLVEEKVPLTTVQELMGHASVATTQRYVTTMPHEMRKAVENISIFLNPDSSLEVKKLNGAKDRMKYSDVRLPTWLQTEPAAVET